MYPQRPFSRGIGSGRQTQVRAPADPSPHALRISAKDLGQLALPRFCERCFWLTRRQRKLPFNIFPGIFSAIDSYSKAVLRQWVRRHGSLPKWLEPLGQVKEVIEIRRSDFAAELEGVFLTGEPDAVLRMVDGSWTILDMKTARFTPAQDELLPLCRVQLNAYWVLAEAAGMTPLGGLALLYCEPPTREFAEAHAAEFGGTCGFSMPFRAALFPLEVDAGEVRRLAREAKRIYDLPSAPRGRPGCQDCASLAALHGLTGEGGSP